MCRKHNTVENEAHANPKSQTLSASEIKNKEKHQITKLENLSSLGGGEVSEARFSFSKHISMYIYYQLLYNTHCLTCGSISTAAKLSQYITTDHFSLPKKRGV